MTVAKIEKVGFSGFQILERTTDRGADDRYVIRHPSVKSHNGCVPLSREHWMEFTAPVAVIEQNGASVSRTEFPAGCRFRLLNSGNPHVSTLIEVEYPTEGVVRQPINPEQETCLQRASDLASGFGETVLIWREPAMAEAKVRNAMVNGIAFMQVSAYVRKNDQVNLSKELVDARKKNPVRVHADRAIKLQELFGLQGKVEEFLHATSGARVVRISTENEAIEVFMTAQQYMETCKL